MKLYLVGSFVVEEEREGVACEVKDLVAFSDVSIVCDMLGKEKFEKNDLLVCLLSSLVGIISSDVIRNDHALQYDIASKTISLLTSADKAVRPNGLHQFSLILALPLALMVEVIPTKLDDIVVGSSIFDDLLKYGSGLITGIGCMQTRTEKMAVCFQLHDVLMGCYSLLYWQLVACRSAVKDVTTLYKKFASSEIFKLTDRFLRYLLHAGKGQTRGDEETFNLFLGSCLVDFCVVLGKTAKKLRKTPLKSTCLFTPDSCHAASAKRKQSSSTRRVAVKKDQKGSSDSDRESEEEYTEREVGSDGSDSTGDMSDYILGASDSDDTRPVKMKHRRNPSNASVRSKEGNVFSVALIFRLKYADKRGILFGTFKCIPVVLLFASYLQRSTVPDFSLLCQLGLYRLNSI